MNSIGVFGLIGPLVGLAFIILWVFVAFTIFGIGSNLKKLSFQQRQANEMLRHLCEKQTGSVPPIKY